MIIIIIIIKTIKITTNTAKAKMFSSQAIILRPSWQSMRGSQTHLDLGVYGNLSIGYCLIA